MTGPEVVAALVAGLVTGVGALAGVQRLRNGRARSSGRPVLAAVTVQATTPVQPQHDALSDTGRFRALGEFRCERHQAIEDAHTALLVEVREHAAEDREWRTQTDRRLDGLHDAIVEVRDAVASPRVQRGGSTAR